MLIINQRYGITLSLHFIIFGVGFHFCKHCSYIAIEVLNQQFVWDFNKKQEEVKLPEDWQKVKMPNQDELNFMTFENHMYKYGFVRFTTIEDDWSKIQKFINEEQQIITISQKGAVDVINSETFEDFINSKLKKPENV